LIHPKENTEGEDSVELVFLVAKFTIILIAVYLFYGIIVEKLSTLMIPVLPDYSLTPNLRFRVPFQTERLN
jgi:hypothetical protein